MFHCGGHCCRRTDAWTDRHTEHLLICVLNYIRLLDRYATSPRQITYQTEHLIERKPFLERLKPFLDRVLTVLGRFLGFPVSPESSGRWHHYH